ncbi:MAG: gamma-glutamylcyclotransferase family protein [Thermoplasmata archaeon]
MKYFAYGSNMDPERMKVRRVVFSKREHAVLEGWEIKFNKTSSVDSKEAYANIIPVEGGVTEGVLYEINEIGLEILDRYEGHPVHYRRKNIKVLTDDKEEVKAVTYVAEPREVGEGLKPSKEYLEHLLNGCDLLSRKYCEKLRKQETLDS